MVVCKAPSDCCESFIRREDEDGVGRSSDDISTENRQLHTLHKPQISPVECVCLSFTHCSWAHTHAVLGQCAGGWAGAEKRDVRAVKCTGNSGRPHPAAADQGGGPTELTSSRKLIRTNPSKHTPHQISRQNGFHGNDWTNELLAFGINLKYFPPVSLESVL